MDIRPGFGRVLVKKINTEKIGGFFIAETSKDQALKGEVISVGPCEKEKDFKIKTGDVVFFPNWGGSIISNDSDGEFVVIKMEDILGVEEK